MNSFLCQVSHLSLFEWPRKVAAVAAIKNQAVESKMFRPGVIGGAQQNATIQLINMLFPGQPAN